VDGPKFTWPDMSGCNGVVCPTLVIKLAQISDGTSSTYFVGEKHMNTDQYATGKDADDNNPVYVGYDWDHSRWGHVPPFADRPGKSDYYAFGSAHASGWQAVYCDGSVHALSYSIDPAVHLALSHREDGLVIDRSQ